MKYLENINLKVLQVFLWPLLLLAIPVSYELGGLASDNDGAEWWCTYMVLLMGVYWVLELLPLPVTALIPVVLLPLFGIVSTDDICKFYMKGTSMLFVGGLIVAIAVEHSNLHRRIALKILLSIGTSPRLLMLGFMIPTAFLSMWISNTATTVMMIPILKAVLLEIGGGDKLEMMMMLAIAYSANVGGTGTLIGTAPNLILVEFLSDFDNQPINFVSWMGFCVPQLIINVFLCWVYLQLFYMGLPSRAKKTDVEKGKEENVKKMLTEKYDELGIFSFHEFIVSLLFSILVCLWFFRNPDFMTGWAPAITDIKVSDATPAVLMVFFMFFIPANPQFWHKPGGAKEGEPVVTWHIVEKKLPWGVIILIGGGFAMAEGTNHSGLNAMIGQQLEKLDSLPDLALLFIILIIISALTQVASNAATASMLLPIIRDLAIKLNHNPLYWMLPATLTCSCAFMLPVSTAPNAIVFEAQGGKMSTWDMMKTGLGMNIITMLVIVGCISTYGTPMFNLQGGLPDWVDNSTAFRSNYLGGNLYLDWLD